MIPIYDCLPLDLLDRAILALVLANHRVLLRQSVCGIVGIRAYSVSVPECGWRECAPFDLTLIPHLI